MKKKLVSLMLSIIMVVAILPSAIVQAGAISAEEMKRKFDELYAQYPTGTYWNGTYMNASECIGFAFLVDDYLFNECARDWYVHGNIDNLCVGDHIRYRSTYWDHSMVVTNISGDTVYFVDCNGFGGSNTVYWGQTTKSQIAEWIARYPLYDGNTRRGGYGYIQTQADNWVKTLDGIGDDRSKWQITGTDGVNIRSGAGTGYSKVGAIAYQQYFYITERVQADGYIWGKVDNYNGVSGWCVLDYAVHVSGPVPELKSNNGTPIHSDENQHVNNGTYMLKNAQSGMMIDVTGGTDSNGNAVVVYGFNGTNAQKFRIEHIGSGKYYLFAVCSGSGRVLDVMRTGNSPSGALTDGCVVDIYNNNDDPAQAMYVWPVGNGKYVLELASTPGRVIAPADEGSASTEGKQLILKTYTGAEYEKWYLCNESGVRIDRALAGISVKNEISKIQYYVGETLQTDGLVLTASYNDGTTEDIASGYTTSYDFSSAGDKTVTLEYGGKTTTFRVSVIEKLESEKAVMSVSSDECYAGTQTEVYVSLKSQNVYDGNVVIQYDSSKLKLVEAKPCGALANRHVVVNTDYDMDKVKISFAGTSALLCDSNVIKLTFVAGENASGAAVVSVHESKMYGKDGNDIETDSTDGTINIKATVNSAEISSIVSESIDGRKVVTANVSSDEVICYLASYRDDVLTECDMQQPADGKIELSVKDSDNVKLMMWNMAMKPLMNVKNVY